jgi:formate hydrogenlyase transcriptional activator
MVQERKFRADLYYRLNVFPITLPPLRERGDDIRLLVDHFVRKFVDRHGKAVTQIPEDVIQSLESHDWPGNIRELQNFIERAVIRTSGAVLRPQMAELMIQNAMNAKARTLVDAERSHITATLRQTNWVVGGRRGAAAILGLPRTTLVARMRKLGIAREEVQSSEGQGLRAPSATGEHPVYDRSRSHPQDADNDSFSFAAVRAANF